MDSTPNLATISASQSAKETTVNELVDALSPASLYGRNADATSALTWGLYGGKYRKADGTVVAKANSTVALTASATNYILETDGVVSKVTAAPSGWPGPLASSAKALYAVVCDGSGVTSYTDYRTTGIGAGSSGATGDVVGPASAVNNHVVFFDGTTGKLVKDSGLTLSGTNTGDQTSVTGNAGTATALQTARTIGGVSFDGSANITQPFDIQTFYPGVPTASAKIYRGKLARAVTFAANFSGSYFTATVNATASTVFDIQKNGASVGSCTIAAGTTTPTFASSGGAAVSFAAGDILSILSPGTADATLADPAITLAGTR